MSDPAQTHTQDVDTGTGEVVNPGVPVAHVDVEDGASIGHTATPESPESGDQPPAAAPPPAEEPPPEPPQKVTRDEIYAKAQQNRDTQLEQDMATLSEADRRHVDAMNAEAAGIDPATLDQPPSQPPAEPPPQPAAAQPNPPAQPAAQPPVPDQAPPAAAQPPLDPNGDLVTITVYGMQEQVPQSDVDQAGGVAAYQKQRAADEKLKRLTTYEASLRDYDRQLAERAERMEHRAHTPAPDSAGSADPSPTDDPNSAAENDLAMARQVTAGMFSGDEEQAAQRLAESFATVRADAMRAAQASGAGAPVTAPGQLPAESPSAIAEEQARQEANTVFANEFGDLQTPVLRRAVLAEVQEVAADPVMRGRPLAEITREAAMRVRDGVFGAGTPPAGTTPADPVPPAPTPAVPAGTMQPTVPTDIGGRMALKSRTVVTPLHETGARYTAPAESEQQFPSNKEYVNQLRIARGQPPV